MKKIFALLVPVAGLALASCSSEPTDWRPDKKVSLDMVAPGTRPSDNFDQGTDEAPAHDKGGAIPRPINSEARFGQNTNTPADAVMSADTQEGTAQPRGERDNMDKVDVKQPGATDASGAPGSAGAANPATTSNE